MMVQFLKHDTVILILMYYLYLFMTIFGCDFSVSLCIVLYFKMSVTPSIANYDLSVYIPEICSVVVPVRWVIDFYLFGKY